jgi:hypothetical protein
LLNFLTEFAEHSGLLQLQQAGPAFIEEEWEGESPSADDPRLSGKNGLNLTFVIFVLPPESPGRLLLLLSGLY